jgi:UDPglucose 6-dehydrogenase
MGRKVLEVLGGMEAARGKKVALLGLTFKPNTDDMRDSPAIAVAQALTDAGVKVAAYDPEGMELARPLMPQVEMCDSPYDAIRDADAVTIVTEWDAFRALDFGRIKDLAKAPVLVDLRNIYRPEDVRAAGFAYTSIGRD